MALTMIGVKYKSDKRDLNLQHGGWFVKIGLWLLFNMLPFFFPVGLVNAYGAPCARSWLAASSSNLLCVSWLAALRSWHNVVGRADHVSYCLLCPTLSTLVLSKHMLSSTHHLNSIGDGLAKRYTMWPLGRDC